MNVTARIITIAATGILLSCTITGHSNEVKAPLETKEFKGPPKIEMYAVQLVPQNRNSLQANLTAGRKCKNHDHDGCMHFNEKTAGSIRFYLPGPSSILSDEMTDLQNLTCDPGKPRLGITDLRLTDQAQVNPDGTKNMMKGNFVNVNVSDWVTAAIAGLGDDGTYLSAALDSAPKEVILLNLNNHDVKEGPKTLWYRVTVTTCKGVEYVLDPRVDNEGGYP